jgi:16S rRNA C967 or C1407 C5-methylase (RsmB/RsmF family)/NOL1/NOP2/fmu family ribosome biogenesis protein
MLPQALIQSLQAVVGFDEAAFTQVHESGQQITSIRRNPNKQKDSHSIITTANSTLHTAAIPWCAHGYYLSERPSFTLDPTFHAGAYYVQEASSMFLWEALKQTVGQNTEQVVLDLCAAPGGKSTLLASYFNNGFIVSNEVIKQRASVLVENITKWGHNNIVVTNNDPQHFQALPNFFDVLVVDAPCSGSGLFRRDPNAIQEWSLDNVMLCSQRQQRILADVLPTLKQDGVLIYSTCSYSKEEDEDIMDWLVQDMQLNSLPLTIPQEWGIIKTISIKSKAVGYRFYPNKLQGEGFFIAIFKKSNPTADHRIKEMAVQLPTKQELATAHAFFPLPTSVTCFKHGEEIKFISQQWLHSLKALMGNLYIKKAGTSLGSIKGKDLVPHHELAMSILPLQNLAAVELDEEQALNYLRRKDLHIQANKGWALATYKGLPLGWMKVLPNRINNYYPQEWRILKA